MNEWIHRIFLTWMHLILMWIICHVFYTWTFILSLSLFRSFSRLTSSSVCVCVCMCIVLHRMRQTIEEQMNGNICSTEDLRCILYGRSFRFARLIIADSFIIPDVCLCGAGGYSWKFFLSLKFFRVIIAAIRVDFEHKFVSFFELFRFDQLENFSSIKVCF